MTINPPYGTDRPLALAHGLIPEKLEWRRDHEGKRKEEKIEKGGERKKDRRKKNVRGSNPRPPTLQPMSLPWSYRLRVYNRLYHNSNSQFS